MSEWLVPVAVLCDLDYLVELPAAEPDVFDVVEQRLGAATLRRALRRLPRPEREVLSLRYGLVGESLGWPEVCAALGCSDKTARRAERRGLQRLRESLAPTLEV